MGYVEVIVELHHRKNFNLCQQTTKFDMSLLSCIITNTSSNVHSDDQVYIITEWSKHCT